MEAEQLPLPHADECKHIFMCMSDCIALMPQEAACYSSAAHRQSCCLGTSYCTLLQLCCLWAAVMLAAGWHTCLRAPALATSLYPDVFFDGLLLIDIAVLVLRRTSSFSASPGCQNTHA